MSRCEASGRTQENRMAFLFDADKLFDIMFVLDVNHREEGGVFFNREAIFA